MNTPKEIAKQYLEALDAKDYTRARAYLADDLSFSGPIDTFDNAEALIGALKKLGTVLEKIEIETLLGDGNRVGLLCVMTMKPPAPRTSFVSEWYRVEGNKITAIRVLFDARPFAAMFGVT
jgi:hypothetical protein